MSSQMLKCVIQDFSRIPRFTIDKTDKFQTYVDEPHTAS